MGNFVLNFITKDRHWKYFSECSRSSSEYLTITYDNVVCVRKSLSAHTYLDVTIYGYVYDLKVYFREHPINKTNCSLYS